MTALVTHLTEQITDAQVLRGAYAQTPEQRTLIVKRGASGPYTLQQSARTASRQKQSGTCVLLVECWEYERDPGVYDEADARLNELENAVIDSLPAFVQSQHTLNRVTNLEFSIDPDGDLFRPSVASQITLTFTWRGTQ